MAQARAGKLGVLFVCANDFREATAKQALWAAETLATRGHRVLLSVNGDPSTAISELSDPSAPVEVRAHSFRGPRLAPSDVRAAVDFAPDVIHAWNPRLAAITVVRRYAAATG